MAEPRLPFDWAPDQAGARLDALDRDSRAQAVDPRLNVALEASAGTGKTKVLVDRYVNLLRAGVDPSEILALTFTRKAAAEMRERIVATLRTAAGRGEIPPARWRQLRDRTADVSISTIDAFCLSLLREFPLEADLDPGFSMADDTEVPRLIDEALDRALRVCRSVARDDEHVALVFAQLGDRRARRGLAALLGRRIIAPAVLSRYVAASRQLSVRDAAARGRATLCQVLRAMRGGVDRFLETGPLDPSFALLAQSIRELEGADEVDPVGVQSAFARARAHFLTQDGTPRSRLLSQYRKDTFASPTDWRVHRDLVVGHAPAVLDADRAFRHDLNALVARGVLRMFRIAETEYRRTLDARAVLDFPDVLLKALELLRQMEEFSQSRFRLESRYHHVLVDEFQDTSRAQWRGARVRASHIQVRLRHRSSSWATGNSPSTRFGTPMWDCSGKRRGIWGRCGPAAMCVGPFRGATGRRPRSWPSSTVCATTCRRRRTAATLSSTRSTTGFPLRHPLTPPAWPRSRSLWVTRPSRVRRQRPPRSRG
jgi:ATP-dependent helicase/nuclease subunit A